MGSGESTLVPGGGTEGYHVLRVSTNVRNVNNEIVLIFFKTSSTNYSFIDFSAGMCRAISKQLLGII